jgi:hypothetical protein
MAFDRVRRDLSQGIKFNVAWRRGQDFGLRFTRRRS